MGVERLHMSKNAVPRGGASALPVLLISSCLPSTVANSLLM